MIRSVRGHPAAVLAEIRNLELLGLLHRSPVLRDRAYLEVRLTAKGLELMETSISHWARLVRKWDSVPSIHAARFDE